MNAHHRHGPPTAGLQFGTGPLAPGPGPHFVPFNVPFAAVASVVQITMEQPAPLIGQDIVIIPGSITALGFTIVAAVPFAGGEIIHWVAFQ